jgi:hypothetical protein
MYGPKKKMPIVWFFFELPPVALKGNFIGNFIPSMASGVKWRVKRL